MKPSNAAGIASFAALIGTSCAQTYITPGCAISPEVPFPANTVCNVRGTLGPSAAKYEIDRSLSGRTDVCAQNCVLTPGCKFASQSNRDTLCYLYNATAPTLGFKPDANADRVNFAQKCYFNPTSCSAQLQCKAGDSCGGKFLAASADKADAAFYPTAFVPNAAEGPNKRTTFTVNTKNAHISIQQDGKQFIGTVPATDRFNQPSVISFTSSNSLNGVAAPLVCRINREQIALEPARFSFVCNAPVADKETQYKSSFYSCKDAQKNRNTLRIAEDPYYQDLGGCYDEDINFGPVNYVANH